MTETSDVDEFLSAVLPRQLQAEVAILNGDSEPRKILWSHNDPVTIMGAAKNVTGWPEVERTFDWLGSNFSNGTAYELDVNAAGVSGDLGYIAGHEHSTMSVGGAAPAALTLRGHAHLSARRRRVEGSSPARRRRSLAGDVGSFQVENENQP